MKKALIVIDNPEKPDINTDMVSFLTNYQLAIAHSK